MEIPPYRNQRISSPVQVNFYVCNGKRKRSQYQSFTYLSPNGKPTNLQVYPLTYTWFGGLCFLLVLLDKL